MIFIVLEGMPSRPTLFPHLHSKFLNIAISLCEFTLYAGMGYWHFCQAMLLLALVRHPPPSVVQVPLTRLHAFKLRGVLFDWFSRVDFTCDYSCISLTM